MNTELEKIYVAIEAQTAQFNKAMEEVNAKVEKVAESTTKVSQTAEKSTFKMSKSFKRLGKMIATIFIGAEINNFLRKMTELSYKAEDFKATTTAALKTMSNLITPVLESIIKGISKLIAWFTGLFYSMFYGSKAMEKYEEDVLAASKANNKFKGSLSGFDELNTVGDNTEQQAQALIDVDAEVKKGAEFWDKFGAAITGFGIAIAAIGLNKLSLDLLDFLSQLAAGEGMIANFAVNLWTLFTAIGEPIAAFFGMAVDGLFATAAGFTVVMAIVVAIAAAIVALWNDAGPIGTQFRKLVEDTWNALGAVINEIGKVFLNLWNLLVKLFNPNGLLGGIVAFIMFTLVGALNLIVKAVLVVLQALNWLLTLDFKTIKNGFDNFVKWLGGAFKTAWDAIWKGLANGFIWFINLIIGGINSMIKGFLDPINGLIKGWNNTVGKITGKIPEISISIPMIPYLAKGGSLDAGSLFIAGEAGAEMIGSHNGKTTVMPLENTSFVAAMKQAMIEGLGEAMANNGSGSTTLVVDGMTLARAVEKNLNKLSLAKGGLDIAL